MMRSENKTQEWIALILVGLGVILRVLPHPDNFVPVAAIALFAGAVLPVRLALTVPLAAMIASDWVIGPHSLFLLTWGSFALTTAIGVFYVKGHGWGRALTGTLAGSILFFIVTNLGVFFFDRMYPMNSAGFIQCFTMALPFFRNTLAGDLVFAAALFGVFAAAKKAAPAVARPDTGR